MNRYLQTYFFVIMLEIVETIGKKHDKNNYNFSIIHTIVFYDVYFSCIPMFFLLQCKFFVKIIDHTIILCNFILWKI